MEIRQFQPTDAEQVTAIWNDLLQDSSPHNAPHIAIERKIAMQSELFFVGEEHNKIVGTVMAGYDGHRGWIYALAVRRDRHRRGLGRKLVAHAETALKELNCPKVNLQVRANNRDVIAFYESVGYSTEQRISMGKTLD